MKTRSRRARARRNRIVEVLQLCLPGERPLSIDRARRTIDVQRLVGALSDVEMRIAVRAAWWLDVLHGVTPRFHPALRRWDGHSDGHRKNANP